jgi:high-affinity Fe2+/Pb2+ permease
MQLWSREIVGWVLMALGVYVFFRAFNLLTAGNQFMLEGGTVTIIGAVLFRGGIHLLKIAVAARICTAGLEDAQAPARSAVHGVRREIGR